MSARFEVLATDLFFPEGPVVMSDGSILICEIGRRQVTRIALDGSKEIVASLEGAPNGAAIGPDGKLHICNNGGGIAFGSLAGITQPIGEDPAYSGGSIRAAASTGSISRRAQWKDFSARSRARSF